GQAARRRRPRRRGLRIRRRDRLAQPPRRAAVGGVAHRRRGVLVVREHLPHRLAQFLIVAATVPKQRLARLRRRVADLQKDLAGALVLLRGHDSPPSRALSHARATRQSLSTVVRLTPSRLSISWVVNPPKNRHWT